MPLLPFANRERPVLLGHRGVPKLADGNTRASFMAAVEAGLDGIETDVQRTKDGVLVIHHDFVVGLRMISDLTFGELRELRPEILTLEELLELLEPYPDFLINLEIKSIPGMEDGRAYEAADAVTGWSGRNRVWISSYDPVALLKVRERQPDIPLGYLFRVYDTSRMADLLGIEAVHPEYRLLKPELLNRWHRKALGVATWTVNDVETARSLISMGVDVIMGDDADALLAAKGVK
ncbi:glycerophosphodiester phosphodiesterase [Oceanithermus sp.]